MEKPDVFMPLYIGDYLAGTSRLTTELHGAYMLLIMDYWMNGAPPDNDQVLAAIVKMPVDAWSIARASIEHHFSIENGVWKHKRIDQELAAAYEKKRIAKEKAERAAAARWEKERKKIEKAERDSSGNATSNATSTSQELLEECPSPSPSPSPSGKSKKQLGDKSPPKKKRKTRLPDNFCFTQKLRDLACNYWVSKNRPDINPDEQFESFVNHHRAKGSTMACWESAWKTWYANAVRFTYAENRSNGNSGNHKLSAVERVEQNIQRRQQQRAARPFGNANGKIVVEDE